MKFDLAGHTALITGSDRNTGEVIARTLAGAGAVVVIHSNASATGAAECAQAIPGAHCVVGDIATAGGCDAVCEQLRDLELSLDILVNNYGTASRGKWLSASDEDWLEMYQKNVLSVARLVRGFTPGMVTRGWGRIINLGTIGSHRPGPLMPHYYLSLIHISEPTRPY